MSLLDDVRAYIITLGAPWTSTNVFCGEMPDEPALCATIYEYPGELTHTVGGGASAFETARFQVVVRDAGYSNARQYANALLTSLDAVKDVSWSGTRYDRILAENTPHPLPPDAHDRRKVAVNYAAWKDRP